MASKFLGDVPTGVNAVQADNIALVLRLGLGAVFLAGGWWKLSRAVNPEKSEALVAQYMASDGYINSFFEQYLFSGPDALVTPIAFLIILSSFEFFSGIALIAGLFVRALSFVYAFLLWAFVIALPVVTAPGAEIVSASHFSPALLVQIRDVGLSGMFFVLFYLGSGRCSVDQQFLSYGAAPTLTDWNAYGLLLRLSVAAVFIVGGLFAGYDHIKTFVDIPILMIAVGVVLASGHFTRVAAAAAFAMVAWCCFKTINFDATLWNNFNAIKREVAYLAACGVLFEYQGGRAFRLGGLMKSPISALLGKPLRPIVERPLTNRISRISLSADRLKTNDGAWNGGRNAQPPSYCQRRLESAHCSKG